MSKKKKYWVAGVLLALLLAGGALALSDGDSLISLSYLTDIFAPKAVEQGTQASDKLLQDSYDAAQSKLDEINKPYQEVLDDGRLHSGDFRSRPFERGDALTLEAGAGFTLLDGSAAVTHAGAVIDVTAGEETPTDTALSAGHRYLVGEDTAAVLTVRSGLAHLGLEGYYTLKDGPAGAAPFTDVREGEWYTTAVDFAYERGLLTGTGNDQFSPDQSMSRAMMMTVFYRLVGSPEEQMAAASTTFDDVPDASWFAPFVRWAASQGITSGTSEIPPLFSPDQSVTREQVAVMLYGFAAKGLGKTLSGQASLSVYPDGGDVSSWAETALSWALANGVFVESGGQLLPKEAASRGQVVLMIMNFSEKIL